MLRGDLREDVGEVERGGGGVCGDGEWELI